MWRGGNNMTYRENRNNPEGNRRNDDPPDGVKRRFDGVADRVPPDKCCEVLHGDLTHEKWDENDSGTFADIDDFQILLKWRGAL